MAVIRTATEEGGGIYSCLVPDDEDIPEPSDGDGKYTNVTFIRIVVILSVKITMQDHCDDDQI